MTNRLEEEPTYMDVEELRPSPECQQRRRNFIAGRLEQSWPTRILSTGMTFRRKLDMQNYLFRLPPRIHPMDPLNLYYMRMGEAYPQSITQPWWLDLVSNLTRDGVLRKDIVFSLGEKTVRLAVSTLRLNGLWVSGYRNVWIRFCYLGFIIVELIASTQQY